MTSPLLPVLPTDPPPTGGDGLAAMVAARRAAAWETGRDAVLPNADAEEWRYSPIGDLDLPALAPVPPPSPAGPVVCTPDGTPVEGEGGDAARMLGALDAWALPDPFAVAAVAGSTPLVIVVPPGHERATPVDLADLPGAPPVGEGDAPWVRHVVVVAGSGSEITIVDRDAGAGPRLELVVVEVVVGAGARARLVQLQDRSRTTTRLALLRAVVERDATFTSFHAGLGGSYARQRTDCRLVGPGASAALDAAFFGDGDQTLDFRTFQRHEAPHTTSNLYFAGAVGGRARSVYSGLIRIEKEAKGASAFQTNRNLKLSEHAWADSVPNLEIENNDVRCSHASTVSPVDPDQQFYLESRGVPAPVAERLIVEGFFADLTARIGDLEAAAWLAEIIAGRLDGAGAP